MGQTVRVTRSEAEQRARWLQENDPDRAKRRFALRERGDDDWEVASVEIPEQLRRGPLTEMVEARPRPSPADDPRTGAERRAPGLPGGV